MTTFRVNGVSHDVTPGEGASLLLVLREHLGITSPKAGCLEGVCGACSVLLDGDLVRSCVVTAAEVAAREVTTLEGLGSRAAPIQRALVQADAFQCGYCAPGMIVAATALLETEPHASEARIVEAMDGNVCRCCTYPRIVQAIRTAQAETA